MYLLTTEIVRVIAADRFTGSVLLDRDVPFPPLTGWTHHFLSRYNRSQISA